jgi:hypothetical protein
MKTALALVLCLLVAACGASLSTKDWMQKVSGITIPSAAESIAIYDKHEAYKALYCKLSVDDMIRTIEKHGFTIEAPRAFREIETSHLPKAYIPNESLRYATGALDYNAWDAVIDTSTGDMWLLVESPDFSGDLPSRALKNQK